MPSRIQDLLNEYQHTVDGQNNKEKVYKDDIPIVDDGWQPPHIETDRLLLRELHIDDGESVFTYASDSEIVRNVCWSAHRTMEDSTTFIKTSLQLMHERHLPGPLAITFLHSTDKVIGTIGGFWKSQLNECMEVGYAIGKAYWGQGIATEANRALVDYMFSNYRVVRIQALTTTDNVAGSFEKRVHL
jgi:ribosomal-protein-alanine N-acetyltransferase